MLESRGRKRLAGVASQSLLARVYTYLRSKDKYLCRAVDKVQRSTNLARNMLVEWPNSLAKPDG